MILLYLNLILLLSACFLTLPYWYYQIMRILIFCSNIYLFCQKELIYNSNSIGIFVFITSIILFNPVFQFVRSKEDWMAWDFYLACAYLSVILVEKDNHINS